MPNWVFVVFSVLGGACVALQPTLNGGLARFVGPHWTTAFSFLVGGTLATVFAFFSGSPSVLSRLGEANWYNWIGGGICGALLVLAFTVSVPRIGVVALVFSSISGQVLTAMTIDHFGFFGVSRTPMDLRRAAAIPLILLALWLVQRPAPT